MLEQFTQIYRIQIDEFGDGIGWLMVNTKAYEQIWIYFYVIGWCEGFLRGAQIPDKDFKNPILNAMKEVDWFVNELYVNNEGGKFSFIKNGKTKPTNDECHKMGQEGLREGSELGRQLYNWLQQGMFPSSENAAMDTLLKQLHRRNNAMIEDLEQGGESETRLLRDLKLQSKRFSM